MLRDIKRLTTAEKIQYKFLTVLLLPIILLTVFAAKLLLRRKEKEFYLAAIAARLD